MADERMEKRRPSQTEVMDAASQQYWDARQQDPLYCDLLKQNTSIRDPSKPSTIESINHTGYALDFNSSVNHGFPLSALPNPKSKRTSFSSCFSRDSCCDDSRCDPSTTSLDHTSTACSLETCLNPEQCDKTECCSDEACTNPGLFDTHDWSTGYGTSEIGYNADFADYMNHETFALDGSMPCQWLETDHQCSVTAPPGALSQHVFKDHIDQNTFRPCGWAECDQTIGSEQLLEHVVRTHRPAQYVCLWQGCGNFFSSDKELAAHMSAMHCTKLDCHWGGCDYIDMDPTALKSHVTDEHLSIAPAETFDPHACGRSFSFSSSRASSQHETRPSIGSSFLATSHQDLDPSQNANIFTASKDGEGKHLCLWSPGLIPSSVCGEAFPHENDLQAHVEAAHLKYLSARSNPLGAGCFVCKWRGCKTSCKPYNGKDKLRKHLYTHTGCE